MPNSSPRHDSSSVSGGGPKIVIPRSAIREKNIISICLPPKPSIPQPPNTISLAELADKCCQKIYNSLENSLEVYCNFI